MKCILKLGREKKKQRRDELRKRKNIECAEDRSLVERNWHKNHCKIWELFSKFWLSTQKKTFVNFSGTVVYFLVGFRGSYKLRRHAMIGSSVHLEQSIFNTGVKISTFVNPPRSTDSSATLFTRFLKYLSIFLFFHNYIQIMS